MRELEIIFEDPRWVTFRLDALATRAVAKTLGHLGFDAEAHDLAVLACDDTRIADLNGEFRDKSRPTNVLSWPAVDIIPGANPQTELGDIAIAYDTCEREAAEQQKTLTDHVTHLLVHATLHLLGYDHETDAEARQMETLEIEILGKLGVSDPY